MSSTRRIDASRANGARSRGPVTESGKQISSQNACRHGLLARCVVVEGESHEGFEETLTEHLERFQPADGVELGIVEEMVAASWRMRRAWAIESRLLTDCVDAQPPCDPTGRLTAAFNSLADSPALALLHRYEIRLHRMYQRGLRNLQRLQRADTKRTVIIYLTTMRGSTILYLEAGNEPHRRSQTVWNPGSLQRFSGVDALAGRSGMPAMRR